MDLHLWHFALWDLQLLGLRLDLHLWHFALWDLQLLGLRLDLHLWHFALWDLQLLDLRLDLLIGPMNLIFDSSVALDSVVLDSFVVRRDDD